MKAILTFVGVVVGLLALASLLGVGISSVELPLILLVALGAAFAVYWRVDLRSR